MENCRCCDATTRDTDDAGRCAECHLIADRCREQMANGELLYPELSARIESGRSIPIDPAPAAAGTSCDACGQAIVDSQRPYRSGDQAFYVHEKCWKVLLTL
jgi:hypothetical protein